MKKTLMIVATVVGVLVLGNVLIASAQVPAPGANADWMTEMHQAVWTAVAKELGMTYDELTAAVQGGKTLWQIADEKGVSIDRLQEVMRGAREAALKDLVAQGAITQEQADWMLSHSNGMMSGGFGNCGGSGMMNGGMMRGGSGMMGNGTMRGRGMMNGGFGSMQPWNSTPAQPDTSPNG